jgi:predicted helicase
MSLALKPAHATVKAYYETLHQFGQLYIDHEGAVRSAFQTLLAKCGQRATPKLTLVPEYRIERARSSVVVDGALVDLYHLPHGYWEAKDEKDDLAREVERKLESGYPRDNIIFQAPERAILYQGGVRVFDENISRPEPLVDVVNAFFDYKAPHIQEWEEAVLDFSERIPELATAVKKTIDEEKKRNPSFVRSFEDFYALCRQTINPNLSEEAVERMLVQHLLTERIFRKIFNNPDFTRRNVVAAEIEKVIAELTKRSLNRDDFLRNLERFYRVIERSAEETTTFSEKQAFLNKVYERFFQGYSPKEADTHGIVYTPQPIVNFMVRSVEEILRKEFGRSLGDKGVHILDPFVGTGNFIVRIMQEINTAGLPYKYESELHCNEVMLLPYYIASMNIEHKYFEKVGEYKAFPGICLVDTFEIEEPTQAKLGFVTAENAERVQKQKAAPIFVIIGNPPYNAGQVNENDSNKNRKYEHIDERVSSTYAKESGATLLRKLQDPYVKAFRWATDRIGEEGVIAFVSNSSFVHDHSMDGMRAYLEQEFDRVFVLDLGGNVRKNPKLSGTTHNVFGIQVGVSINILIRSQLTGPRVAAQIFYASTGETWRKEQKCEFLNQVQDFRQISWRSITPDERHQWLTGELRAEFGKGLSLGGSGVGDAVFLEHSLGVSTNRDAYVYAFSREELITRATSLVEEYNNEASRFERKGKPKDIDAFLRYDNLKWSDTLKKKAVAGVVGQFDMGKIIPSLYRPFAGMFLYYDSLVVDRPGSFEHIFRGEHESENVAICLNSIGNPKPFHCLASGLTPDLHLTGDSQCFPFYTYAEDGTNRRENINDWALEQFRSHYHAPSITKWDIFHYIYAVLHHPEYRQRYAANLRRELPRIPFVSATTLNNCHSEPASAGEESAVPSAGKKQIPRSARNDKGETTGTNANIEVFRAFVKAGQRLAEIHVHYEQQPEYPLTKTEKAGEKLDYRVTKMRLSKDKTSLIYNQFLTLSGIPADAYEYRLGNRSALEWVIDQYQVSTDKRSGITNDPNRADDQQYILRLIGQVITVSLETVKIVRSLPPLGLPD